MRHQVLATLTRRSVTRREMTSLLDQHRLLEQLYCKLSSSRSTPPSGYEHRRSHPLTDCTIHKWQDDTSILPNGFARFTVRHAACLTGKNFHIVTSTPTATQYGNQPCNDTTIRLPQEAYTTSYPCKSAPE